MPDVALLVAAVALFYGLFFGDGASRLFRDSDTGWHLRVGEALMAGQPLPRTDPYSFSKSGQPWFAWEWGADLIMAGAYRLGQLPGVAILFALLGAVCVWLWFRLHWAVGGNFLFACAMAAPMLTTLSLHWLARPHVFSWLLILAVLLALERAPGRFVWWHAMAWLAAGALWANLHASFFFLPVLALVYAAGSYLRRRLWNEGPAPNSHLWAAIWGAAGTLANPYGLDLHWHVWRYLNDRELLSHVGEFQSFNFHAEGAGQILLTLMLAMLGAPLALRRRRVEHFLLACGLIALALRSARALPLVALVALPLANGAFTAALEETGLGRGLATLIGRFLDYSRRLRQLDAGCGGYAWAPAVVLLAVILMRSPALASGVNFPAAEFPVMAAAAVEKLPDSARLLAPDKYGGYLIYRFSGRRKVFFDGRSDFYGAGLMKDYIRLIEARPGWRDLVNAWGFTHALLPNRYSLVDGLEHWGWKRVYRDDVATLLARN